MSRAEAEPLWRKAEQEADIVMSKLLQSGQLEFDPQIQKSGAQLNLDADISEEQMAWWCLREAFIIALSPINDKQVKDRALRLVLAYTKPKPAAKSEVARHHEADNEAWLKMMIDDHLATLPEEANAEC